MSTLRKCEKCGKEHPATLEFFNPRYNGKRPSLGPIYLSRKCRDCNKKYANEYSKKNNARVKINARRSRDNHKLKKLCRRCNGTPLENSQLCEKHWFMGMARNAGLQESIKDGALVKKVLEDQNYTCPYTGEKLVPGLNCSLDHKLPRSRYPELTNDISNLEWTTILVNRSKYTMTKEEYITFIQTINNYIDGRFVTPITI